MKSSFTTRSTIVQARNMIFILMHVNINKHGKKIQNHRPRYTVGVTCTSRYSTRSLPDSTQPASPMSYQGRPPEIVHLVLLFSVLETGC